MINKLYFLKAFTLKFEPYFTELGFTKTSNLKYVKKSDDIYSIITFTDPKPSKGLIRFTMGVGILLVQVERFWRPKNELNCIPTIGVPIHLLRPEKRLLPWFVENENDIDTIKLKIEEDMTHVVLPFFKTYSNSKLVLESFSSDNPNRWFSCSKEYRNTILLINEFLTKGKLAATNYYTLIMNQLSDQEKDRLTQLNEIFETICKLPHGCSESV